MNAVDGEDSEHAVVQHQDHSFERRHGLALILLAGALLTAPYAGHWFLLSYAAATIAWLFLRGARLPLAAILLLAVLLRLPCFLVEPALSGDVYRYLSDGRALASGTNPYDYTPADPRINHPGIRSIYPPHAQWLFAAFHRLVTWRALVVAFDLAAILLLALAPGGGLARREAALAWATFPFAIIEGTWSGHIDAIAGVVLLAALRYRSGAAAGFAAGLKVIPLAAVPALWRKSGHRLRFAAAFLAALLLPALPFMLPFIRGPFMPGMRDYATRWIFNSPLYAIVRSVVEIIPTKAIWTAHPLRFEPISDAVYRHLYPDFLTRAILGVLAVAAVVLARRVTTSVGLFLLCSPAIHPWYWLTLAPAAMAERSRWIAVAACAPFSYLLYGGAGEPLVWLLCYGVPAALAAPHWMAAAARR